MAAIEVASYADALRIARAAGADAANKRMRSEGRTSWDEADYVLACKTTVDLMAKLWENNHD